MDRKRLRNELRSRLFFRGRYDVTMDEAKLLAAPPLEKVNHLLLVEIYIETNDPELRWICELGRVLWPEESVFIEGLLHHHAKRGASETVRELQRALVELRDEESRRRELEIETARRAFRTTVGMEPIEDIDRISLTATWKEIAESAAAVDPSAISTVVRACLRLPDQAPPDATIKSYSQWCYTALLGRIREETGKWASVLGRLPASLSLPSFNSFDASAVERVIAETIEQLLRICEYLMKLDRCFQLARSAANQEYATAIRCGLPSVISLVAETTGNQDGWYYDVCIAVQWFLEALGLEASRAEVVSDSVLADESEIWVYPSDSEIAEMAEALILGVRD